MLTIEEALAVISTQAKSLAPRALPLAELRGLTLAESVTSAVDSPPFDKSMVDGFALAASDRSPRLRILEMVVAGSAATQAVQPGTVVRVMTGAPIPEGADAVVKWEDCEQPAGETLANPTLTLKKPPKPGECVARLGSSFRTGEELLAPGKRLTALDVALLAEIGRPQAAVVPRPRVGVLATGDELVDAAATLGPSQIRNSNGPMLLAAVAAAGAEAIDLGVARDEPAELREKLRAGLEYDVLLASGGVSAGVKDLVPGILRELGVGELLHQVRIKPGKPLWFGARETPSGQTLVFGLPGNPVSTFVSFKLFVEPALGALGGDRFSPPRTAIARLAAAVAHHSGRPSFQPSRRTDDGWVEVLPWRGSADLASLTRADCLIAFPAGDYELNRGSEVSILPL